MSETPDLDAERRRDITRKVRAFDDFLDNIPTVRNPTGGNEEIVEEAVRIIGVRRSRPRPKRDGT